LVNFFSFRPVPFVHGMETGVAGAAVFRNLRHMNAMMAMVMAAAASGPAVREGAPAARPAMAASARAVARILPACRIAWEEVLTHGARPEGSVIRRKRDDGHSRIEFE